MSAAVLLELLDKGIAVDVADGRIRCRHAAGALSPGLAARVRQHRDEILELLGDPDALRLAMAMAIFDAEPVEEEEAARLRFESMEGLTRCDACQFERNRDITQCPACHPAPWLPADCLAPISCTVLGPCERLGTGKPCGGDTTAESAEIAREAQQEHIQAGLFSARGVS